MNLKRLIIGAGLAVGLAVVLAACGGSSSSTTTAAATGPEFIYISPNPIGVNKFLELGQTGTDRAAQALGGTSKTFESTDLNSRRTNLEAAVAAKPDVVVLTTFEFTDLAKEFATNNPDQQFILIDACPDGAPSNLHCGVFREQEGAYLLGIEAGSLTTTNKIGSVVALDIPFLHRWSDGFAIGAASVDPNVTDSQVFVGGDNPFSDPARSKEQALALAAQGVDQIFAVTAGGNGGVFEAAKEKDFQAYGVDVNQCPDAPGFVVDNNLKLVDNVVESLITQIMAGDEVPTLNSFGLKEKGTSVVALSPDLANSECVIADHPDIVAKVKTAAAQIIDGTLVVADPAAG